MTSPVSLPTRRQWSDADFDEMMWHDVHIHAIGAVPDEFALVFDVDYILEWVGCGASGDPVRFWVAPATLRFENAGGISIELASQQGVASIQQVKRTKREGIPSDIDR